MEPEVHDIGPLKILFEAAEKPYYYINSTNSSDSEIASDNSTISEEDSVTEEKDAIVT